MQINHVLLMGIFDESLNVFKEGLFGLEKEQLRCDSKGNLSAEDHPTLLGRKDSHPYITTDFAEAQIECITPPLPSIEQAYGFLKTLTQIVYDSIGDENLWPYSAPPFLESVDDISVAQFSGGREVETLYRELLVDKYGKWKHLYSGVHFNYSLSNSLIIHLHKKLDSIEPLEQFKSSLYLKIIRNSIKYRWALLLLQGNSPVVANAELGNDLEEINKLYGLPFSFSLRNSLGGYAHQNPHDLDYSTLENYKKNIKELLLNGSISHPRELYESVRLKENTDGGVSHLELRFLDLEPEEEGAFSLNSAYLVHSFFIFMLLKEENNNDESELPSFIEVAENALNVEKRKHWLEHSVFIEWRSVCEKLGKKYAKAFSMKFENHGDTVANYAKKIFEKGYTAYNLYLANKGKVSFENDPYRFWGEEDRELSTQILMKEAVKRGISVEFLDRKNNFIRLNQKGKKELVCQATKTSLDSYVSVLAMENKYVTKLLLDENDITTPKGELYTSYEKAIDSFSVWEKQQFVVKPLQANFGLGITIFSSDNEKSINENNYKKSIKNAFQHDDSILIEEFEKGQEFRFFVVGGKCLAILKRVPAHVKGDGKSSIEELVAQKNNNYLRGEGYKTPLEKIHLGEFEASFLAEQGYKKETCLEKGKIVYLRSNSNISTGGESHDYTDQIHFSYKEVAVKAAKLLNINIVGLDIMIEDIKEPLKADNYSIIELNFNPAIHIHHYPLIGQGRNLAGAILNELGY